MLRSASAGVSGICSTVAGAQSWSAALLRIPVMGAHKHGSRAASPWAETPKGKRGCLEAMWLIRYGPWGEIKLGAVLSLALSQSRWRPPPLTRTVTVAPQRMRLLPGRALILVSIAAMAGVQRTISSLAQCHLLEPAYAACGVVAKSSSVRWPRLSRYPLFADCLCRCSRPFLALP